MWRPGGFVHASAWASGTSGGCALLDPPVYPGRSGAPAALHIGAVLQAGAVGVLKRFPLYITPAAPRVPGRGTSRTPFAPKPAPRGCSEMHQSTTFSWNSLNGVDRLRTQSPPPRRSRRKVLVRSFLVLSIAAALLQGCVASSVVGTGVAVAGTGVSIAATTVKTTAKVAGAGVRLVTP